MEQQDKINLLISIQEHPDEYTDEQLRQMFADAPELEELLEKLALTKQGFVKQETDKETIPVEEEWQKFATEHANELEALDSDEPHTAIIKRLMGILPYKVAATFIGFLFTAGVAFAAIYIVRIASSRKPQIAQSEQVIPNKPAPEIPADTIKTDTIVTAQSVVFDNMPLEKMLPQIAAYYDKEVEFMNADARKLRFYFVWKQDETLDVVLHRLNLFESVAVELKSDKIIVE